MNNARPIECTIEEYHLLPHLSRSQHTTLFKDPALFHGRHISHIYPPEAKKAWDVGTVAHACLLEPDRVDAVVKIIPEEVLNAQGHRKGGDWRAWKAQHAGFIDMKVSEFEPVEIMIANVRAHPMAATLLEHAIHFEYTIVWEDPETGLPLRVRPDMISEINGKLVVPDFKTDRSVEEYKFRKNAPGYGYHRQATMYPEGVASLLERPVAYFPFICVDKNPAYQCEVYTLSSAALELGRQQNRSIRRDFLRRMEEGDWHSDSWGKSREVDFERWAYQ